MTHNLRETAALQEVVEAAAALMVAKPGSGAETGPVAAAMVTVCQQNSWNPCGGSQTTSPKHSRHPCNRC